MTQNSKPIEYKFILLGDSLVGKSSLYLRLSGNEFSEGLLSTIGTEKIVINFDNVEINQKDKKTKNFKIILFDTAGQEKYRALTKVYYKGTQGIILIYSIVDNDSFKHIETWLDSIKDSLSDWKNSGYMVMLLGNKLDVAEENPEARMISTEECENFCSEKGIYWGGECSAKTFDENELKEIFTKFIIQIYSKLGNKNIYNMNKNQKQLVTKHVNKENKISKCCSPD